MKAIFLTIIALCFSIMSFSQTIIESPNTGISTAQNLRITKIERTDSTTVLSFYIKYPPGNWISIPRGSYIQPVGSKEKLFITDTEGIPLDEQYIIQESGEKTYAAIFPAIDESVTTIDFGEANDGGSWFIYDIQLKPHAEKSMIPEWLNGNWYNKNSGLWEISFMDSMAVYQSQTWKYKETKLKGNNGSVTLTDNNQQIELIVKRNKNGNCSIGKTSETLSEYTRSINLATQIKDTTTYGEQIFKLDSATYCGLLKNYTPRVGIKTFIVYINNILTGDQNSYVVKIKPDGQFSVKLPLINPEYVFINSRIFSGNVYLEPGKSLFQLTDSHSKSNSSLFMGELAKINNDLIALKGCYTYNYREEQNKVLELTAKLYKSDIISQWKQDLKTLNDSLTSGNFSKKSAQIAEADINYNYASNIMSYQMNFEGAYRRKNNIPYTDRSTIIPCDSVGPKYFDFITNKLANNPIAPISSGYNTFINRLKFLELLRPQTRSYSSFDLYKDLKTTGYNFTASELQTLNIIEKIDSLSKLPEIKFFNDEYGERTQAFYQKYMNEYKELAQKNDPNKITIESLSQFLTEKDKNLTDDEQHLIESIKKRNQTTTAQLIKEINITHQDSINAFHQRYGSKLNEFYQKKSKAEREEKLESLFNVKPGLATDIMNAQDICRKIVSEMTPVTDNKIQELQKQIIIPFIANYLAVCNNATRTQIAMNKQKEGFTINEVPKTDGDKVFEAIMEKYKGKVVFVDFWATWCGPCRSGIERIKPLKEEIDNEKVAFVYITNQSSPENTWSNMIPDIKGEHYRVSADEWNYLCSKFNISGIPHYVLVGKERQVINPELGHMENASLKILLEKHMNE